MAVMRKFGRLCDENLLLVAARAHDRQKVVTDGKQAAHIDRSTPCFELART